MSVEGLIPQTSPQPGLNLINPVDGPRLTFPPFPEAPEGVQIEPFATFQQRGILMEGGPDDVEVDSLGVATIALRVRHANDVCKTNTKRKRRAEDAASRKKRGLPVKKLPWWEQWEEAEATRWSTGFDHHSSRFERIHAAATDFRNGRTWPIDYQSETGPKFIFGRFLRYIGLPDGGPVPGEKKKKKAAQGQAAKDADENMSDDEFDDPVDEEAENEPMSGIILDNKIPEIVKEQIRKISNDDRLHSFFDDPCKSIKVFLSSYAVEQGFIWYDANLECMGRILGFFVNFLLRSKVLPEIERGLRRSLEVIATSVTELPNISALSKNLPDDFSAGCVACWGRKSQSYTTVTVDMPEPTEEPVEEAKKEKEETEEKADKEENAVEPSQSQSSASGWGATSSWNTDGAVGGWGDDLIDTTTDTDAPQEPVEDVLPWNVEEKSLFPLMGPTAFPLTHEPGVVEQSMRRIKAIVPPSSNPPKPPPLPEGVFDPDADAVENELERRFAKIVLEPMLNWDAGDSIIYSEPTILPTSVGAVVGPDTPEATEGGGGPKPFDPFKDDITLLVENNPEQLALLSAGMGMAGVWVQIARQNDGSAVVKKKKKGKSKKVIPSYWYMETLATTVVSFWTA